MMFFLKILSFIFKFLLKVGLIVCVIFFLASHIFEEKKIQSENEPEGKIKELPKFYFSILPSYYDSRFCWLEMNEWKSNAIQLSKNGFSFNQVEKLLDAVEKIDSQQLRHEIRQKLVENKNFYFDTLERKLNDSQNWAKALSPIFLILKQKNDHTFTLFPKFYFWSSQNQFHQIIFSNFFVANNKDFISLKSSFLWTISLLIYSIIFCIILVYIWFFILYKLELYHITLVILKAIILCPFLVLGSISVLFLTTDLYSSNLNIFPGIGTFYGSDDSNFLNFFFSELYSLLLPALVLSLTISARIAIRWASLISDELEGQRFIALRSKGLSKWQIISKHLLRITFYPILIYSTMIIISLLNGVLVIENLFAIPGVGRFSVSALNEQNLSSILWLVGFITLITFSISKISDDLISYFDPRKKEA